ncbi:MAG TPA: class I SAM-dependent methyltransferase [Planctomycetota bacterium]|nr:class I SAM-dependent methyltransferase [Planctomycetota bacterium]
MVGDIKPEPVPAQRKLESVDSCPLCDTRPVQPAPVQPEPPFGICQCPKCNLIFLSPRPPVDAMKTYYDEYYEGDAARSPRQENRAARHIRRLMRYASKPGRLLDVGAGDGYFLNAARKAGWQVEGLELSQPRVKHAKDWFDLTLHSTVLSDAPFAAQSFDAIGMFQLIEHVHDPRAVLKKVHELLRPGGILMMSTPNVLAYARKNRDVNTWRIPRHLFFFTPRTLVNAVENSGFTVLRRPLKFFATLEERLGWQPWHSSGSLARVTRDLWTPFGLHLIARKES